MSYFSFLYFLFYLIAFKFEKIWVFIKDLFFRKSIKTETITKMLTSINYTGQRQKYTLSETSQTVSILGRWLWIRHPLFLYRQNFVALIYCRFWADFYSFEFFKSFFNPKITVSDLRKTKSKLWKSTQKRQSGNIAKVGRDKKNGSWIWN